MIATAVQTRWEHQISGVEETTDLLNRGAISVCLTSPTGGGKSWMIVDLIEWAVDRGERVNLFTTRKLLTEQLIRTLTDHSVEFGVIAAGFDEYVNPKAPVQLCSSPTINARVFQRRKKLGFDPSSPMACKSVPLPRSDLDLFDEVHMQKGGGVERICREKEQLGSRRIGLTATPLGISHLYQNLVVAGTNSELRICGALLPCHVKAPDEPDLRDIKRTATGEFNYNDVKRKVWTQQIFGRIFEHWKLYNPDARPTILFAPGVEESVWCARQFEDHGVRAAHIDGDDVYVDGERFKSSRTAREDVIEQVRDGRIPIVCNRFVLREGIDIPELYHCILATPIGSLLSYVQTVGRVLRNHESLDHVLLQDHGGNWWRHGSPNADRDWQTCFNTSVRVVTDLRLERIREQKEDPGIVCIKCGAVQKWPRSGRCYQCDFDMKGKRSRIILQADGSLKEVEGAILKPRRIRVMPDTQRKWTSMYHRMRNADRTFRQAEGLFAVENYYYPPRDLPLMPVNDTDWFRKIRDVPNSDLRTKPEPVQQKF